MLCLPGSPALSDFRLKKLQQTISQQVQGVTGISARFLHLIDVDENALSEQDKQILSNLLTYGPVQSQASLTGKSFYVMPRAGTISPWSSKATDIAHQCGLTKIRRVERGYSISG